MHLGPFAGDSRDDVVVEPVGAMVAAGQERDLAALSENQLAQPWRDIRMVFQDPFSSLNPRMTVFDIISEPLVIHDIGDAEKQRTIGIRQAEREQGRDADVLERRPDVGDETRASVVVTMELAKSAAVATSPAALGAVLVLSGYDAVFLIPAVGLAAYGVVAATRLGLGGGPSA